jgi:TatA/E family protein of Tat protein translocase
VPFGIGHWELIALGVVLVLLFGTSRVPAIARQLGRGVREARDSLAAADPRRPLQELERPESTKDDAS